MIIKRKLYSLTGTRVLAGFNKKVLRKTPMAAKRSAIKTQNKVLEATARGLNKIEGVKMAANQAAINPGRVINTKVIQPSIEAPITSVAMKTVPIPGTSTLVSVIGKPEKTMWKKIGVGDKMSKAASKYVDSKGGRVVEDIVNSSTNYFKNFMV